MAGSATHDKLSDAHGHDGRRVRAPADPSALHAGTDPPGDLERAGAGGILDEDQELLTSETKGDPLVVAQGPRDEAGDPPQTVVARLMPVRVIEHLEMIDIEEKDGGVRPGLR